jgi:hypothetical protein
MNLKSIILATSSAVVMAGLLVGPMPSTAQAVGTGAPVVTAPANGSTVASGYAGPIKVDFSNAPADTYDGTLQCGASYYETQTFVYDGSLDAQMWAVPAIAGPQTCSLSIDNNAGSSTSSTFTVTAPPLVVDHSSISPSTFYPLVRDGYRDSTTISYRLNRIANVSVRIRNSLGYTVRLVALGTQHSGQDSWAWNGRQTDGTYVRVGTYKIQITAVADRTMSVVQYATVATGSRTRTVSKYRSGYYTSSTSRSTSCYVTPYAYDLSVDLDCWGGAYAQANYNFLIPSNAYNLSWGVAGYQGCCAEGTISKSGIRASSTVYGVIVRVTNWREYTITYLTLTYTYTYRI